MHAPRFISLARFGKLSMRTKWMSCILSTTAYTWYSIGGTKNTVDDTRQIINIALKIRTCPYNPADKPKKRPFIKKNLIEQFVWGELCQILRHENVHKVMLIFGSQALLTLQKTVDGLLCPKNGDRSSLWKVEILIRNRQTGMGSFFNDLNLQAHTQLFP